MNDDEAQLGFGRMLRGLQKYYNDGVIRSLAISFVVDDGTSACSYSGANEYDLVLIGQLDLLRHQILLRAVKFQTLVDPTKPELSIISEDCFEDT